MRLRLSDHVLWAHEFDAADLGSLRAGIATAQLASGPRRLRLHVQGPDGRFFGVVTTGSGGMGVVIVPRHPTAIQLADLWVGALETSAHLKSLCALAAQTGKEISEADVS